MWCTAIFLFLRSPHVRLFSQIVRILKYTFNRGSERNALRCGEKKNRPPSFPVDQFNYPTYASRPEWTSATVWLVYWPRLFTTASGYNASIFFVIYCEPGCLCVYLYFQAEGVMASLPSNAGGNKRRVSYFYDGEQLPHLHAANGYGRRNFPSGWSHKLPLLRLWRLCL